MFDLVVIIGIIGFGWLGYRQGAAAAGLAALEMLAALVGGVLLFEPLASLLADGLRFAIEPIIPQGFRFEAWGVFLAFALLVWGTLAAFRFGLHRNDVADVNLAPVDRFVGLANGLVGGTFVMGAALITLSMLPLFPGFKPYGDRMFLDAGKLSLLTAGSFAGDMYEGRSLVLFGEPISTPAVAAARLTSEPWFDVDADSKPTEADRYRDEDGGGSFTADLYYLDLDGDRSRRIGLIAKYVAGCWDYELQANSRDRPDQPRPTAESDADDMSAPDVSAKPADEAQDAKPAAARQPSADSSTAAETAAPRPAQDAAGEQPSTEPTPSEEGSATPSPRKQQEPLDDF